MKVRDFPFSAAGSLERESVFDFSLPAPHWRFASISPTGREEMRLDSGSRSQKICEQQIPFVVTLARCKRLRFRLARPSALSPSSWVAERARDSFH
jgi:hypothetical protein